MSEKRELPPTKRLSHQQRSESSQRKLIEATISCLTEVGYSKTSTQEICNRAGLSKGGLFRQFPTRTALMIATGKQLYDDLLMQYERRFNAVKSAGDPISSGLRLVRENFASPQFQAAMELQIAARTDPELSSGLKAILQENQKNILALTRRSYPASMVNSPGFDMLTDVVVLFFQGEAFESGILRDTKLMDARIRFIETIVRRELEPDT